MARRNRVDKCFLLSNSPDGESAAPVKCAPLRVVCRNTLAQALSRGFTYSARHDRDLWGQQRGVQYAMGLIPRRCDGLARGFDAPERVPLEEPPLAACLEQVVDLPE